MGLLHPLGDGNMADLRLADDGFDGFFKNVGLFEKLWYTDMKIMVF